MGIRTLRLGQILINGCLVVQNPLNYGICGTALRAISRVGEDSLAPAHGDNSVKAERRVRSRSGFTLIDVLVTMVVIGVLIGIMLPSFAKVKETTQRVVCSSNVRQLGLGVSMFSDNNDGFLPKTTFVNLRYGRIPSETTRLRIGSNSMFSSRVSGSSSENTGVWDGLGRLFEEEYLETRGIFYCPSHDGENGIDDQLDIWNSQDGDITGNFQYRGEGANGNQRLFQIVPRRTSIISDSIRSEIDLNHDNGMNVLRADLAVFWFSDLDDSLRMLLRSDSAASTDELWNRLDGFVGADTR
jgi:prepilin-type N-terminal cleavage/methylation domain-containing protein